MGHLETTVVEMGEEEIPMLIKVAVVMVEYLEGVAGVELIPIVMVGQAVPVLSESLLGEELWVDTH